MKDACFLMKDDKNVSFIENSPINYNYGKLIPKDGKTFHVLIRTDNPNIKSLTREKILTEQAAKELEKQIGFDIKIYDINDNHPAIDIFLDFKLKDDYFTANVLAYAGYPVGSLKGIVVFNSNYIWLDGQPHMGDELRKMGIILPGMRDDNGYATYNYKQTIKHEMFGHTFGLPHTNDPEDTMYPYYGKDRVMYGKQSKDLLIKTYGTASAKKRAIPDSWIKSVMYRKL